MPEKQDSIELPQDTDRQDIEKILIDKEISLLADIVAGELASYMQKTQLHEKDIVRRLKLYKKPDEQKVLSEEMGSLMMQRDVKVRGIFIKHMINIDQFANLEKQLLNIINNPKKTEEAKREFAVLLEESLGKSSNIRERMKEKIKSDIGTPFKELPQQEEKEELSTLDIEEQKRRFREKYQQLEEEIGKYINVINNKIMKEKNDFIEMDDGDKLNYVIMLNKQASEEIKKIFSREEIDIYYFSNFRKNICRISLEENGNVKVTAMPFRYASDKMLEEYGLGLTEKEIDSFCNAYYRDCMRIKSTSVEEKAENLQAQEIKDILTDIQKGALSDVTVEVREKVEALNIEKSEAIKSAIEKLDQKPKSLLGKIIYYVKQIPLVFSKDKQIEKYLQQKNQISVVEDKYQKIYNNKINMVFEEAFGVIKRDIFKTLDTQAVKQITTKSIVPQIIPGKTQNKKDNFRQQ